MDDDDDSDGEIAPPKQQQKKVTPPPIQQQEPVRDSMTSRASENIRETEVNAQPAPVTKAKPESPKEEEDTGRKSIA